MSEWKPIESAPNSGVVLLAVENSADAKVFVAERSFRDGEPEWVITVGWEGWNRLHPGWKPIAWRFLPEPPK